MADGGSSPLGDPGGLHVYSMNGGTHKLTELVADGSSVDMMGSAPVCQMSYPGTPEPSPYTNSMQSTFTYPSTLGYDSGSFEDMKRSSHLQPSYYTPMESPSYLNSHSSIFDMSSQGFSAVPDMYKTSTETVSYTEMLPKANNISPGMSIKKEKIDYTDQIGMIGSHSSDIPYPPNTCIADWNYFNSTNTVTNIEQPHYSQFNQPLLHSSQQFTTRGQYYNTNQEPHVPLPLSLTNEDIHQQSKKITQSIISSEWSNETLYKSTMYSSLNEEGVVNKKRRAIVDRKGRDSRSRKKKPGELGGHSKAVASILLSDSEMTNKNNATHRTNENILDSGERNSFVTTLMNNLRSTVQFESFCLSLPRSPSTESAFNTRVRHTSDTISALGNQTILSKPFPPNYIQGAEKVMLSFKKALNNTEKAAADLKIPGKNNIDKERDLSCDQVEEHIPHSMVWVLRVGERTLNATWEGQFVATVNPVQNTLCCSIFQFSPRFSAEGIKCLHQCLLSKSLAQDILINMEQFEVSRQLRFDIKLKSVAQMYLYTEPGNVSEGCLLLEVSEELDYFQRWLHTSAEDKNRWRKRCSFFQQGSAGKTTGTVYIGGLISELNELVALMLACNPELKDVYDLGTTNPFLASLWNTENGQGVENGQSRLGCVSENTSSPGPHVKEEVRKQIRKVLAKHGIRVDRSEGDNDDIRVDESLSNCFRDYVNFACESATELDTIMKRKVSPWLYGFYDSDFNMLTVPNADLEQLTVAQLISNKCSEIVYFSFCRKEIGQLGHDTHCALCRKCFTFKYQHCYSCNRCSEVKTVCEFCGHLRDDQSRVIIKPLSVFKSELRKGAIVIDSEIEAWCTALQQPDDDVLCLKPQYIDQQTGDRAQNIEYNSSNAMVDQLGLLNPVGFLLGQGAVGATRKHRRYKGMQPSLNSLDKTAAKGSNSIGGCILQ